ncbi:MAG: polysaccharide deacetylase family protein [Phocaeicola sp.]
MFIAILLFCLLASAALFYASYSISAGFYLKSLCCNYRAIDAVALTFDDGVNPDTTPEVLQVLKRHRAKATFFLIGERAEAYPDLVRQIVAEGHTIGNHSYYHRWNFPLGSEEKIEEEMSRCQMILEKITGERVSLFRPPFGVTNPNVARAVRKSGLQSIGWSIRSFDTMGHEKEKVVKRVLRQLKPGKVVLLHDDRAVTPLIVEQLLEEIEKRGWRAVTVQELFSLQ